MTNQMTRREMLRKSMPTAAVATAATGVVALGATAGIRQPSEIPTRTIGSWDDAAEWYSSHQDLICCTPAERDALVAARPEMSRWQWLDFGDRLVGMSPWRSGVQWPADDDEQARFYVARLNEVKRRRALAGATA